MALVLDLTTGLFSGDTDNGQPETDKTDALQDCTGQQPVPQLALQEYTGNVEHPAPALPGELARTDAAAFVRAMARKSR